jgi:hypothetical protein
MSLFGFFGEVASATVKIIATPIAVASDIVNVATGNEPEQTKKLIKSAGKDIEKSIDQITGEY